MKSMKVEVRMLIFSTFYKSRKTVIWCNEAPVYELVPPQRVQGNICYVQLYLEEGTPLNIRKEELRE